jgi:hypothetical protein
MTSVFLNDIIPYRALFVNGGKDEKEYVDRAGKV